MIRSELATRRRQLDRQLTTTDNIHVPPRPLGGWIRCVRESLGMTLESFGSLLGVTRATAHQIERAEVDESITIKRLRLAADALGCDLLIQIVPRQSLNDLVHDRAYKIAQEEFQWLNHTMVLENQATYDRDQTEMIEKIANDLIERKDSRIWNSK